MEKILIVDDEEPVRQLLNRFLGMRGYQCTLGANAAEARKYMSVEDFDLVLCDINMPGESGMDFIRYLHSEYSDTGVLMVTAMDNPEIADAALEMGAYGYIIKPFKYKELLINVNNALRRQKLEVRDRLYRENLEQLVSERTAELQETWKKLGKTMEGIIQTMSLAVESRDPYTAGHQRRVADLAHAMATEMGLSKDQIEGIRMAGIIHDLGKISIPIEILTKPGRITDTEFSIIKTHCQVGYDIMKEIDFPWPLPRIILQHHERIDGSGYPQGLSGENILLEAKIIGVADVLEAMASHRPYRPALGIDTALKEISRNKNMLYASQVVDACLKLFSEKGYAFDNL